MMINRLNRFAIYTAIVLSLSACEKNQKANIAEQRSPSAAPNVIVLDSVFDMPGLDRKRKVRIYLPPNYDSETDYYPVLYMHDAQNLFDDATSYAGEWRVDETLNKLSETNGLKLIVIGIDNGEDKRMTELSAWDNDDFGKGEGQQYLSFIVDVVKPYVDTHYRTKADIKNTGIMGSSMGGLISHYGIYARPDVFSKAGIYSPSYWYSQDVFTFTQDNPLPKSAKLDFLVGTEEGGDMVSGMEKMVSLIESQGHPSTKLRSKIVQGAKHNEGFWASEFEQTVLWLFSE